MPPNEPDALAQRLARLCSNRRLAKRLARDAARRAKARFTWRAVARSIAALYEDVESGRALKGALQRIAAAA